MCIHVNIARGKQHGDPRKIPALSRKNAHGDAPNESRAHTGSSRVMWADRASSDQAWVSTSYCLHHTVYIIPSTSHRLHLPLCVYITPSTSHRPHHTVYIIPLALPTRPQPVPVATLRTSHVSRERAAWHSARCVIYIRVYMHM